MYTKTNWVNQSTPAINATNLNKIEDKLVSLDTDVTALQAMGVTVKEVTISQANVDIAVGNVSSVKAVLLSVRFMSSTNVSLDGESHSLNLNAFSTTPSSIWTTIPDSNTTKYRIKYYFSGGYLYINAASELVGLVVKSIWLN